MTESSLQCKVMVAATRRKVALVADCGQVVYVKERDISDECRLVLGNIIRHD